MMTDILWLAALPHLPAHSIFPRKPDAKSAISAD